MAKVTKNSKNDKPSKIDTEYVILGILVIALALVFVLLVSPETLFPYRVGQCYINTDEIVDRTYSRISGIDTTGKTIITYDVTTLSSSNSDSLNGSNTREKDDFKQKYSKQVDCSLYEESRNRVEERQMHKKVDEIKSDLQDTLNSLHDCENDRYELQKRGSNGSKKSTNQRPQSSK